MKPAKNRLGNFYKEARNKIRRLIKHKKKIDQGKTNKNNFEELETKIKTKRTLENRYMRRN